MVVTSHFWGHCWAAKRMLVCFDSMAVVSVLRSGTSKDPNLIVLLQYLSLCAAHHSCAFTACHRAGRDNCIADALSCLTFSISIISHHMQHRR